MPYKDPDAQRAHRKRYYLEHREEIKRKVSQWRTENAERSKAWHKEYRNHHREWFRSYKRKYYIDNKDRLRAQAIERKEEIAASRRALRKEYKRKIIDLLGSRCKQCGIEDRDTLCIDHVNGDGRRQRLGSDQYRHYLRRVLAGSSEFQLLCHNCNWIKRHENREWGEGGKRHKSTHELEYGRQRRLLLKQELIDLLGGGRCKQCGFSDIRALHIDHIKNNGGLHRKSLGNQGMGANIYPLILKEVQAGSQEYQVLCANCHHRKTTGL